MCGLPNWLDVMIERADGPSYRVVLEGMALEYRASVCGTAYGPMERIRPRAQAWREFLTALEAAGAWQWAAEYRGEGTDTRWSIEVAAPFRQLSSTGNNAYPPGEGFALFCTAMQALLDGRAFE